MIAICTSDRVWVVVWVVVRVVVRVRLSSFEKTSTLKTVSFRLAEFVHIAGRYSSLYFVGLCAVQQRLYFIFRYHIGAICYSWFRVISVSKITLFQS